MNPARVEQHVCPAHRSNRLDLSHPQSLETVDRWFRAVGFEDMEVRRGPDGVVGRGRRPVTRTGETQRSPG
jgi:hypothetical protein